MRHIHRSLLNVIMLVFVMPSCSASAEVEALCPNIANDQEWKISEQSFTKEAASKAIESLSRQVEAGWSGEDWYIAENDIKLIKGYLFKSYISGQKKEGVPYKNLVSDFCRFLDEEAFYEH